MRSRFVLPNTPILRSVGLVAIAYALLIMPASSFALAHEPTATLNAPATITKGAVTKLNLPPVTGGYVFSSHISPDGNRVVYMADQDTDGINELYSVPIGGGTATKLNGTLVNGGDVSDFIITPDSSRVVYRADQTIDNKIELYSVPIGGGATTKLNGIMPSNGDVFAIAISPDSSRVVYEADQDTDGINELYSVSIGGGTATKLNGVLVSGGNVVAIAISPNSSRVVYLVDQNTDNVFELYSVPIGGGTATKLNGTLVSGGNIMASGIAISPDSSRVVYVADQTTDEVFELYSVPIGGGTATKLNGTLVTNGDVGNSFKISPNSSTVIYQADQDIDSFDELYSVPIGGGTVTKLSDPANPGVNDYELSADGNTVVYQTDEAINEVFSVPIGGGTITKLNAPLLDGNAVKFFELSADSSTVVYATRLVSDLDELVNGLYSVPIGGGTAVRLTPSLAAGSTVDNIAISPDSSFVIYSADQDTAGVFELYGVPLGGGTVAKLNSALVSGGDVYSSFSISSKSSAVVYQADQDTDGVTELYSLSIGLVVNQAPVAANDSYSTKPNTALNVSAPGVLGNDTDADGDTLTAALVSQPSHGSLTLNANGSFSYTPATGFSGSDTFTYTANDGGDDSNVATVHLTVASAANQAPVATADSYSTSAGTTLSVAAPGVLANDTDADGDTLTAALVSQPSHGTLTLNSNGSFSYTPVAGFSGSDSFTYEANDGGDNSNTATVTITVEPHKVFLPLVVY